MKIKELRLKNDSELKEQILSFKKELMNLRFQKATDQLANTARMRLVRRGVARIKTLLTEHASNK